MGMRVRTILVIALAISAPAGAEVPPDARQRNAEVEVASLAETARVRYGRRQFFEEVRIDSRAVRLLEDAYGPLHPRVIEHLGALLDKHGGHLVPSTSLPLASWMLDKLEAIPGTPLHVAKGIGALVGYWRWAVEIPGYAMNRLDYSAENVSFGLGPEVEAILQRTLDMMANRLGAGHPDLAAFRRYVLGERLMHLSVTQAFEIRAARGREIEEAFGPSGSRPGDWRAAREAAVAQFGPDDRWLTPSEINEALKLLRLGEPVEAARLADSAVARMDRARVTPPVLVAHGLVVAGGAYVALGAHDKAEPRLQRAIGLMRPYQGERWARSLALSHGLAAAGIFAQQRRPAEALEVVERILSASRDEDVTAGSSNRRQTHRETQLLRARLLRSLHRPAEAIAQVDEILSFVPFDGIQAAWRRSVRPLLLVEKARALLDLGRLEEASAALRDAEPDLVTGGDGARAALLEGRARLAARAGRSKTAILLGKLAVGHLQSVRRGAVRLDPSLERGFLAIAGDSYQFVADLLIETGRLAEAQQMLALLKDDEFDSFTRRSAGGAAPREVALSEQEAGWESRYQEIKGRVAALAVELDVLRGRSRRGETLSGEDERRRDQIENDLRTARIAFDAYLVSLMGEFEKDGVTRGIEVGAKNLESLRALQATLRQLGHGAVAVHYLVTEDRVRILVTTPTVQVARESAVTPARLARLVQAFRERVMRPLEDPVPQAQELYRLLVQPIQADLDQSGAGTLMISLDGVLRYLPMAALHHDGRYLAQRYRLALYNEAARDKLKDAPAQGWRFAGLGLTRPVEGFTALPSVRDELDGILKKGDRGVLPGEVHYDLAFDRARLRESLERGYPVVHLASHFVFHPGTDVNSYLLLGDGSKLTLREVKESNLPFGEVDLITLSACDTASSGGKDGNGREVEGLGTLLQKQGARSVIATLWPVADESTGHFMREFYRLREEGRLTKAEALRRAQAGFIEGPVKVGAGRRDYSHPFFWAPFILMGNWN